MPDRGKNPADDEAESSAGLAAVIDGARRRAVRDGDRQIDTAHLLHSLLESDAEVRAVTGDAAQLARLFGYLVQRSIGYGLRWQGTVEDSGPVPVLREGLQDADQDADVTKAADAASLTDVTKAADAASPAEVTGSVDPMKAADVNEAADLAQAFDVTNGVGAAAGTGAAKGADAKDAGLSPLAAQAMARATDRARRRGAVWADGTDLLAALVADPRARAAEVLDRAGVDLPGLLARAAVRSGRYAGGSGTSG